MDSIKVKSYFSKSEVVADYAKAVDEVGLWESEKIVFSKYLKPDDKILELGCGAGRIGINLARLGFKNITATDFSENMAIVADAIAKKESLEISVEVCDATNINYPAKSFDAVIFGFNGLMQIPKRKNRLKVLFNAAHILKKGGIFIFTTHDRDVETHRHYWSDEKKQWTHNAQDPRLDDFGDIFYRGEHGDIFIHSPSMSEIEEDISKTPFEILECRRRSEIADEPLNVVNFSDDCIFRVLKKARIKVK